MAAAPEPAILIASPAGPPPSAASPASDGILAFAPAEGGSLLPFAMPLLQLIAQLRTLRQADAGGLRDRSAAALQSFEAMALAAGRPADQVRRSHYALCDSLDEAVLNTPWGAGSVWARSGMVASFHPAVGSGRFFDALRQAEAKVDTMHPVLELMVLCLSLGVMGPYRSRPDGPAAVDQLRLAASAALLAHSPAMPADLSAQWAGVDAPFRRRRARLPVWVAAAFALAVAGGVFVWSSQAANDAGDTLFSRMLAVPPGHMPALLRDAAPPPPAPPAPAEPTVQDRIGTRLAALDIKVLAGGAVAVAGTPTTPVLRLPERVLFAAGSAKLLPNAGALLQAVAEAIRPEGGSLRVLGYLDDRPVRTVAFPSAFKLSAARAEAVRTGLGVPAVAEGRAGADPVAANATAEGREQNRRVEIVLEGAPP